MVCLAGVRHEMVVKWTCHWPVRHFPHSPAGSQSITGYPHLGWPCYDDDDGSMSLHSLIILQSNTFPFLIRIDAVFLAASSSSSVNWKTLVTLYWFGKLLSSLQCRVAYTGILSVFDVWIRFLSRVIFAAIDYTGSRFNLVLQIKRLITSRVANNTLTPSSRNKCVLCTYKVLI